MQRAKRSIPLLDLDSALEAFPQPAEKAFMCFGNKRQRPLHFATSNDLALPVTILLFCLDKQLQDGMRHHNLFIVL